MRTSTNKNLDRRDRPAACEDCGAVGVQLEGGYVNPPNSWYSTKWLCPPCYRMFIGDPC